MNANEIIKELRDMATYDCGFEQQSDTVKDAADLIESLQAEITRLKDELADYNCGTKIGCKLIEAVKAERDAAVEDLKRIGRMVCFISRKEQSMTEIEKAIEALDERFMTMSMCGDFEYCKAQNRAIALAIVALREQAEREKGCEYCRGNVKELVDGDTTIFINHEDKVFYADWGGSDYLDWKHCPMCGRRLEVDHDQ